MTGTGTQTQTWTTGVTTIALLVLRTGELKNDRCFLLTIARSNGVTIVLSRLKTNTLVSATVSSGTGQLGIDYLTV